MTAISALVLLNCLCNKIFTFIDSNGELISMKDTFRVIGFNLILHACFGKEINDLNDKLWINYNNTILESQKHYGIKFICLFYNLENALNI